MKHPRSMSSTELAELPVVDDQAQLYEEMPPLSGSACRSVAFEDRDGLTWQTFLLTSGWVRYPAFIGT